MAGAEATGADLAFACPLPLTESAGKTSRGLPTLTCAAYQSRWGLLLGWGGQGLLEQGCSAHQVEQAGSLQQYLLLVDLPLQTTHHPTLLPTCPLLLCHTLRQVIFSDPYYQAQYNRHTSPQLDDEVVELQADVSARVAAAQLKVCGTGRGVGWSGMGDITACI